MVLLSAIGPDALANVDHVRDGLEHGPIAYIAAVLLLANVVQFSLLMRSMSKRVDEARLTEQGLFANHDMCKTLEKAMVFVMAQQPRKKAQASLGPEPTSGVFPAVKP